MSITVGFLDNRMTKLMSDMLSGCKISGIKSVPEWKIRKMLIIYLMLRTHSTRLVVHFNSGGEQYGYNDVKIYAVMDIFI